MYLGKIVEMAVGQTVVPQPEAPLFGRPALGRPDPRPRSRGGEEADHPGGRRAQPDRPAIRLPFPPPVPERAVPRCSDEEPELRPHHPGQVAACHFPLEDRAVIDEAAGV